MVTSTDKLIDKAMQYLESKVDIGLFRRVDLLRDGHGPVCILLVGLREKLWRRVIEHELRSIIPVERSEVVDNWRVNQSCTGDPRDGYRHYINGTPGGGYSIKVWLAIGERIK